MKKILCGGLLAMMVAAPVYAADVKVTNAWARATVPGQDSASVQLTVTSKKDATLVGVLSGSAERGEIHTMAMEGDVMKMRAIESLPLPAKKAVTLGADGNHLMLIGLKKPLKAGRKLPLAIEVKLANGKTKTIRILAAIKPLDTTDAGHMKMQMKPESKPEEAMKQHEHQHQ